MPAVAIEAQRSGRTESNPILVCVMYAQGGVDWMATSMSGGSLPKGVGLCLLKNFPALISRKDDTVENFGYHPNCAWFAPVPLSAGKAGAEVCKTLFAGAHASHSWSVEQLKSPLLCTLGGSNQLLHPTIIAGQLGEAPGRSLAEAPKVYRNLPFNTFRMMAGCWKETMALAEVLEQETKIKIMDKVGFAGPVRNLIRIYGHYWPEWMVSILCWGAINGTSRLRAAKMPLVENPHFNDSIAKISGDNNPYVMNTNHRFIVDDVPFGLCVLYGMSLIVECPMPNTAHLISQLQMFMQKEYVTVQGARFMLNGRDAHETGAPQSYGVTTREQLKDLMLNCRLPQTATSKL